MLWNYLKIACRNLIRGKGYSVINILGLAIGMACCILILLWVFDELSYDQFHVNKNILYRVAIADADKPEQGAWTTIPYALTPLLTNEYPEITSFTRAQYRNWYSSLVFRYQDKMFYEYNVLMVDSTFLSLFSYPLIAGNPATALSNPNSIVITENLASKYFQDENPIGKTINVNNVVDLQVTGILKNTPSNSELQFDCLMPIHLLGDAKLSTWHWETFGYILLDDKASYHDVQDKISGIINERNPYPGFNAQVKIQPLTDIHLHHSSGDIKLVYIFSLVACIILAIACINYMNLTTARYSRRAKEVGVRKVIGANRNNLLRQFFGETILLSIISLLVAIALIEIALPFFNNLTGKHLVFNPLENIPLIIAFLIIAILVGVGAGLYPAFFLSSFQPVTVLKNAYKSNGFNLKLRSILVVTQFSIAVVLIICAMIISKQHNYMLHKELGYNVDHVLYLTINRSLKENYYTFKNKLLESPLIKSVTCASSLPMSIGNFNPIEWEGKHTDDVFGLNFAVTDHDYINTLNMKIVEGRDFSVEFPSDTANFIINRKAVDLLQLENPLGTKASFMGADGEIIGIVDNFHDQPLYSEVTPLILTINPQNYGYFLQYVLIRVTGSNLSDAMSYIKETSKVFAPNFPCDYNFLDDGIGKLYASVRQTGDIINAFSILAIFISCLGLLGLASFIAEQRTKEIGVRKVLGASISNLLFLIAKDFAKYVIIANLIAWPIAYYACIRFLDNFAYRTSITFDMFVIAGFLALCISLLSVSGQALKAALAYPVDSLRYE